MASVSNRLRPSKITLFFRAVTIFRKLGVRNSFHSVAMIRASADCRQSYWLSAYNTLSPKIFFNLWKQRKLLVFVYFHDRFQDLKIIFHFFRRFDQGFHVFGKTTSTIANSGEQKSFSNSFIASNSTPDHIHIRTQPLTQLCDLVHKRNLGSQKRIGCIFCEFSRTLVHENNWISLAY